MRLWFDNICVDNMLISFHRHCCSKWPLHPLFCWPSVSSTWFSSISETVVPSTGSITWWFWQTISNCRHCLKNLVHVLAVDEKKPASGTMIKTLYKYQWDVHDMKGERAGFPPSTVLVDEWSSLAGFHVWNDLQIGSQQKLENIHKPCVFVRVFGFSSGKNPLRKMLKICSIGVHSVLSEDLKHSGTAKHHGL